MWKMWHQTDHRKDTCLVLKQEGREFVVQPHLGTGLSGDSVFLQLCACL